MVEESPVFEQLAERHGDKFAEFLRDDIEVVDGDVSKPDWASRRETAKTQRSLDVIVNSSGLTDFNPDLRDALAMNVRSTALRPGFSDANAIMPRCCIFPPAT